MEMPPRCQILHNAGIDRAPRRTGSTWKQFLTTWARGILAVDFVHVDTVPLRLIYALIVIEHGTRRTHLAAITSYPDVAWTTQAGLIQRSRSLLRSCIRAPHADLSRRRSVRQERGPFGWLRPSIRTFGTLTGRGNQSSDDCSGSAVSHSPLLRGGFRALLGSSPRRAARGRGVAQRLIIMSDG
jgi:hypothetical protein